MSSSVCATCGMGIEGQDTFAPSLVLAPRAVNVKIGDKKLTIPMECKRCKSLRQSGNKTIRLRTRLR